MEDDGFTASNLPPVTLSDSMDFDLIDELLYDGCWLETTDGSNLWPSDFLSSSPSNFPLFPTSETSIDHLNLNQHQKGFVEETNKLNFSEKGFVEETNKLNFSENQSLSYNQIEEYSKSQRQDKEAILTSTSSGQSDNFVIEGLEMSTRLWIRPSKTASPAASVKKRLLQAIDYLKELTTDSDVLIQIWVPIRRGGKYFLTTNHQPFSYNPNYESLVSYRDVSRRYQFSADTDSKGSNGLPGRVFLKKLPEWTPDVRFFRTEEYPRLRYAQQYSVSGSLALPVFERGSGTCLGVVEIVTTTQKANYHTELENICKALEAFDLRSSEIMSPSRVKDCNQSYQAALAEILDVLKSVCDINKLPLAQTWAPCVHQAKGGCRHSDENYGFCVSTVDSACYVPDQKVWDFHVACSEHHLLRGEGIAGGAFMTNQPCFATDITAFSKTEYPLSHHAKMFELCAAVAIRLRSIYTCSADFVLEFFLPHDCKDVEEQKQMLSSLSSLIQNVCRTLRVVTDQEILEESGFPVQDRIVAAGYRPSEENTTNIVSSLSKEPSQDESSCITHMMEAQRKGQSVTISLGYPKDELREESKVTNSMGTTEAELHYGWEFSKHNQIEKDFGSKGNAGEHNPTGEHPSAARNTSEKRRTKTEKTISLQELRQYFAGSLKDAAKSIGVCPTTLKRICRQHGITRWPSRKIKKVDHSLRKLQLVIDSVQGAEGTLKLSYFYTNFPELSSPNLHGKSPSPISNKDDHLKLSNTQTQGSLLSPQGTASKSHSSSGSHSSSSSFCCSTGTVQPHVTTSSTGDLLSAEKIGGSLKGAYVDADLNVLVHEETKLPVRSQGHALSSEHPSHEARPNLPNSSQDLFGAFRVKATYGDEKIRFSMQQHWGFGGLQREIARRFNIYDVSKINIKYLDDDSEWVLLACDADLEECIDIHNSSQNRTIKLSLHEALYPTLGSSFGSCGPS